MPLNEYLDKNFIEKMMQDHCRGKEVVVKNVDHFELDNSASILVSLASATSEHSIGHFGLTVEYTIDGVAQSRKMVIKIKPHGDEIVAMLSGLAQLCENELGPLYHQYRKLTGFQHTHHKENLIYEVFRPDFTPTIFGLYSDEKQGVFIILMEFIEQAELLNTVMEPSAWTDKHIKSALDKMAEWHTAQLQTGNKADAETLSHDAPSAAFMIEMKPLWKMLLQNAGEKFPELYTQQRIQVLQSGIDAIEQDWFMLDQSPKTIIHNDLNPRNTYFVKENEKTFFKAYDWELATLHTPVYDIAELLCFILDEDRYADRENYVEYYRVALNARTGIFTDRQRFKELFLAASRHFGMQRLGMYMMAHTVSPYPFLPRVVNSFFNSLEVFDS